MTYSAAMEQMNRLVRTVRSQNLELLKEFMTTNYEFMSEKLLVARPIGGSIGVEATHGHQWDANKFEESKTNCVNLVIRESRKKKNDSSLAYQYPIVYCYLLVLNVFPGQAEDETLVDRPTFLSNIDYFLKYLAEFLEANGKIGIMMRPAIRRYFDADMYTNASTRRYTDEEQ